MERLQFIRKAAKALLLLALPLGGVGGGVLFTACTDTWDDHYNSIGDSSGMHEGTLWQAIKSDPNLSNFASVVEACDIAKDLNGSQVFTVFAPTNNSFSQAEAQALIADYRQQVRDSVVEEDNTVIKEFIHNHIAPYNHSVASSSNDSIILMNGKYAVLKNNDIDGVPLLTKNQLYSNGVLYTLSSQRDYLSNVFEYIRKDPDLDSLRSFLYNSSYYYREFEPELSVPGSIVNGKTQYLDSVFTQRNELFDFLGRIGTEDSSYIMVAPTNEVWRDLIEEYETYFAYPADMEKGDSMAYTNSRLAIIQGTTFSRTFNTDESLQDSAMSVNCVQNYAARKSRWGAPFEYFEYYKPMSANGALAQADIVRCSNGEVRKATKWNIDKQMSFHQFNIINAEARNAIKEIKKVPDSHGDSIEMANAISRYVNSDNRFFNKVWDNSFIEFVSTVAAQNYWVDFTLKNVLSNIGYDIYLVTVPALANDSNATDVQRLPVKFKCSLRIPGQPKVDLKNAEGGTDFVTTPDAIDYLLLAEDYKFDFCTYGIDNEKMQVALNVETRVSSTELRRGTYTRTLRIDCILLGPHGSLQLVDALPEDNAIPAKQWGTPGLLMYPHGQFTDRPYKWWYMQR